MKAILVIDMPTDCIKCPLADGYCWNTFPTKGRADGCPLRPLPQKTYAEFPDPYKYGFADGWNKCLEEIKK